MTSLWDFDCSDNNLPVLELAGLTSLTHINCSQNLLTALNINSLDTVINLTCSQNALTALDVSGMTSMEYLYCDTNQIPSLDLTGFVNLKGLSCSANLLSTLDVSDSPNFVENFGVNCMNNQLTSIFAKNGSNEYIAFFGNPDLEFICADESQIADLQLAATSNNPETVVLSYCSFTPGGPYNTVTGSARIDLNGNGCDSQDISATNVRFDLTDNTMQSGTFANQFSNYTLYAGTGTYTLTPNIENPSYYSIDPVSATIEFPELNDSVTTQNFCLTPIGVHPDLEIVMSPNGNARPGFDAYYTLVYRNKGNQTMTGIVNVTFDDFRSDYVSSVPSLITQNGNLLTWGYENLAPFESRAITLVLNVNSPVENPSVDAGDLFEFTASISPIAGDETENDNVIEFKQITTNAMDPNIKTCLEGDIVSPVQIGDYLHYNIEFENLGTAEATNVVVKDVIDTTMFDMSSIRVLYSSHLMRTQISGNKVEFIFQDINLEAAAGTPPVGGHGNVLFKIKTKSTLEEGDHVENKADIFFDYNAPVITDMARTTYQSLSNEEFNSDKSISVYPNPASGIVNIRSVSLVKSIELYDIQGRLLQTKLESQDNCTLDISQRASGVYFVKVTTGNGSSVMKLIRD
ncbi:MAG: T9SS type A sorting domain-containing protein [Pedobacter sp.]|nr:MAG: T9SS type A sorting domain-containing protein [Pedobacter sp.]